MCVALLRCEDVAGVDALFLGLHILGEEFYPIGFQAGLLQIVSSIPYGRCAFAPLSLAQSGGPDIPGRVAEDRSGGRVIMEAKRWKRPGISNLNSSCPDIGKRLPQDTIDAHPPRIGAWILRARGTKSLCRSSHIYCDGPKIP
jgi:hypothetical protein